MELQVTLGTPIVFGDEGFHARMAQYIAEEREYPVWNPITETELVKGHFARPPLWNILIASFLYIFGFNEFFIRFLPPFITFLTGLAIFLLGKELYDERIGFIAAIIAIAIPSFVTYSVLIYSDVLVTFYTTMFFLLFILYIKKGKMHYLILTGIFGAFAFLSKTSGYAAFIFVILVFIYEIIEKRKIFEPLKKYFILFLILILIPSTFFLRNFYYYRTPSCESIPFIDKVFDNSGCKVDKFQ
jgi:4-amino-4-deoxy-L-arabinose transferase-like glycosyltransferase